MAHSALSDAPMLQHFSVLIYIAIWQAQMFVAYLISARDFTILTLFILGKKIDNFPFNTMKVSFLKKLLHAQELQFTVGNSLETNLRGGF